MFWLQSIVHYILNILDHEKQGGKLHGPWSMVRDDQYCKCGGDSRWKDMGFGITLEVYELLLETYQFSTHYTLPV